MANQIFTLQIQQATSWWYVTLPFAELLSSKAEIPLLSDTSISLSHKTNHKTLPASTIACQRGCRKFWTSGFSGDALFYLRLGFLFTIFFFFFFSNDSEPQPVKCFSGLFFLVVPFIIVLTMAMTVSKGKGCKAALISPWVQGWIDRAHTQVCKLEQTHMPSKTKAGMLRYFTTLRLLTQCCYFFFK